MVARAQRSVRRGLSLMEVIISLAIFLLSFVAISHLLSMATARAIDAQDLSRATDLVHSKMAEVEAGVVPLQGQGDTPFDEEPDYIWSMTADQGQTNGLWNVSVTVSKPKSSTNLQTTLTQLVLDPSIIGSTQVRSTTPALVSPRARTRS